MKPIRGQGSQLFTVFLALYYKTEEAHSFDIDHHDFPGLMNDSTIKIGHHVLECLML